MSSTRARFGLFEFSPATGELVREGVPVRLQPQPAKVLALLVGRPGAVVTREELRREVWGNGTHVDFERGLNFCVAQIRTALGDSAESPRYLQTIPKQGYRFIAPVAHDRPAEAGRHRIGPYVAGALILGVLGFAISRVFADRPTVVVIPFYNETGAPDRAAIAAGLGDTLVARLAAPERARQLSVIGNAPVLRNPFARQDVQEISRKLGAEYLVIGQLKTDGARLRLVAHLIRVADMKHLWANTYDDDGFTLDGQKRAAEAAAAAVTATLAGN